MVRAECDFMRPPVPGLELDLRVRVTDVGRSSLTFRVEGRDGAGELYFEATMVTCFIAKPAFEARQIPAEIRQRVMAYRTSCGDG